MSRLDAAMARMEAEAGGAGWDAAAEHRRSIVPCMAPLPPQPAATVRSFRLGMVVRTTGTQTLLLRDEHGDEKVDTVE